MTKTKAEYQREYRERKRQALGQEYLKSESERVKKYYVKSTDLSAVERQRRRKKNKAALKKFRENKRSKVDVHVENNGANKRKGSRKRISHAISKANRKIKKLEQNEVDSKRVIWKYQKKIQRLEKANKELKTKLTNDSVPSRPMNDTGDYTPIRQTDRDIRLDGISPTRLSGVRRKLLFHNVLVNEIKQTSSYILKRVVSGKIVKKYRQLSTASKTFGIRRQSLAGVRDKNIVAGKKRRLQHLHDNLKTKVEQFFERDDNSCVLPGKKDNKLVNGTRKQKRVLNDYLKNLHLKFCSEYATLVISLSLFCKYRPKYISLVSFSKGQSCLCSYHQNMALKLKALQKVGIVSTTNPDCFIRSVSSQDDVCALFQTSNISSSIYYQQWKRVNCDGVYRMQIVECESDVRSFKGMFARDSMKFKEHVERVAQQYKQLKALKENLQNTHMIVQMDFSENYTCKTNQDIQSSYFNKQSFTIHPCVLYYKNANGSLEHTSHVYVSNELCHNAATVYSFIKNFIDSFVKTILPNVSFIHYWTDSPTSQYRNKSMFALVSRHKDHFGLSASWNYFEAGHGKGPCDGIGGTVKRMADIAVSQGKIIQTAYEFYVWGSTSSQKISYSYLSKEDIQRSSIIFHQLVKNSKQVVGTMKVHAVVPSSSDSVMIRDTSCFCARCWDSNGNFRGACLGWILKRTF